MDIRTSMEGPSHGRADATRPPVAGPAAGGGGLTVFDSPLFDSFDGWARLLRGSTEVAAADLRAEPAPPSPPPYDEAPPWVPTRRPALTLLHVVDDGRDSGETVRLRDDVLLVGKTTGGVRIPHDPFLEEAHARLDRLPGGGWLLTDLGSRDGTWVRATTARFRPGQAFRIGSTTLAFDGEALHARGPGEAVSIPVPAAPFLVGRSNAASAAALPEGVAFVGIDDRHVSPVHAEIFERRGTLRIVNHGLNGLWVRVVSPVRLRATAQFQCGEQRFVLEPLADPGPAPG